MRKIGYRFLLKMYSYIKRHGKYAFITYQKKRAMILDVGCGNQSPTKAKTLRPDIYYVGLDVDDYNNDASSLSVADRYVVTSPEEFALSIYSMPEKFDGIISSHNIEHCNNPYDTLNAIVSVLKPGGVLYLAFPCEESVGFPHKENGTLNFYDDSSHVWLPDYNEVLNFLRKQGMEIIFSAKNYKPIIGWIIGAIAERVTKRQNHFTWDYYGFESIIWAKKEMYTNR